MRETRVFGRLIAASTATPFGAGWTRGGVVKWGAERDSAKKNMRWILVNHAMNYAVMDSQTVLAVTQIEWLVPWQALYTRVP